MNPLRKKIEEDNERRLAAFDAVDATMKELGSENERLREQVQALSEEVRELKQDAAAKDSLIFDLQTREAALVMQQKLHATEREVSLTGLKNSQHAIESAIDNIENAIANEIAGAPERAENLRRINTALNDDRSRELLEKMTNALSSGADEINEVNSPSIMPEADHRQEHVREEQA